MVLVTMIFLLVKILTIYFFLPLENIVFWVNPLWSMVLQACSFYADNLKESAS